VVDLSVSSRLSGGPIMAATALLETLEVATPIGSEPRDGELYEIVDGRRIKKTMSYHAGLVATDLGTELSAHIRQQAPRPGRLAIEVLFRIPVTNDSSRQRRPDIAFVSSERWPMDRPTSLREDAWDVVPDLTVEVISPTDRAWDLLDKIGECFQAGVRLVWAVFPRHQCIYVYEAADRIRVLTRSDTLDGGVVLPGFQLPLSRLFDPVAPVEEGV
jgi:Uma2 family endonuclease